MPRLPPSPDDPAAAENRIAGADLIDALAATAGSRARFKIRPLPPVALDSVPELLAGVSEVDLTPPPGLPRAGYSRNAKTGKGFRTRLRARVVHLRSGTSSVAIIATDLLGGSAVVQHLVAQRIATETDVPLAGLFLGATHTHGAPGQFHGTDFYNRFSSNKVGFDPGWTSFLAARISAAVLEAVASRRPAALAWGRMELHGVTRNRSLPAYQRNAGQAAADAASAVNPWLELLRVDALTPGDGTEPLAALALFSIHGTAIPMTSSTYNADLWGYLCAELGDAVATSHGRRPIVGALQGTHGDLTPALQGPAGHPEASRLGQEIGGAAGSLYASLDGRLMRRPELASGFREVDLDSAPAAGGLRLPNRPAVGASLIAGAKENETPGISLIPPFRAGYGKRIGARGPHAEKWVIGSRWLQPLVLPLRGFPRVLPVHLLRVGEVLLTGVPMEITIESGRRIAAAAQTAWATAGGDPVRGVVSSVADEYAGYCATSQEYGAQFYEGGHTLYGPLTQGFIAAAAAELATDLAQARPGAAAADGVTGLGGSAAVVQQVLPERSFDLKVRRYMPPVTGSKEAASSVTSPTRGRAAGEEFVEWRWLDAPPGDLCWHEPMICVQSERADGWVPVTRPGGTILDDGRGDLEVSYLGAADGGKVHRYAVRWYTAPGPGDAAQHRFARLLNAIPVLTSEPF